MFNGVLEYVKATVTISFEPNHVSCHYCPLLETYARNQCRRTGEYIIDTRYRGRYCPLGFDQESNFENETNTI